jgi:murein DD-endopeptidase MepM/ murein hydrolase activator NlpD
MNTTTVWAGAGARAWVTTAVAVVVAVLGAVASGGGGSGPGGVRDTAWATRAGAMPAGGMRLGCAGTGGAGERCWPVTGPGVRGRPVIDRGFDPPAMPWAAGHRGVDLRASPGAPVRAAAPGSLAFTGTVAGVPVVVIRLPDGLRTTYEPVRATLPVGARVPAGSAVGTVDGALPHCPRVCLHWGLIQNDIYLDPLLLLPPSLRRAGPSRLLPVYRRE